MRILESARLWLRVLVFRGRVETEMDKEIRLHLEMETEHNIRHGMSPEEAKRWIDQFVSDLRFAFRGFRRQPAFTGGVVTLIALGVGANAAIFSAIYNLLMSPLPFTDGNRMVQLSVTSGGGRILTGATAETADRWRARARAVESITVVEQQRLELGDTAHGPIERINGVALGPGAMAFVGMQPVYGRDIAAADTLQNAVPVVLLSYGFRQRAFGGQLDAIGRTIVLGNVSHTVIGVMPEPFSVPFLDNSHVYPALRVGKPGPSRAVAPPRCALIVLATGCMGDEGPLTVPPQHWDPAHVPTTLAPAPALPPLSRPGQINPAPDTLYDGYVSGQNLA